MRKWTWWQGSRPSAGSGRRSRLRPSRERAAAIDTLAETAKPNGIDPQARLTDVLGRVADHPVNKVDELPLSRLTVLPSDTHMQATLPA